MALTAKQQRFVEEYLIDLNATQAAIRAGYSVKTAMEQGHQLLQKTSVQEAIAKAQAERSKRTGVTADRVLQELAKLAFSKMSDFAEWDEDGVSFKSSDKLSPDDAACIAEITEQELEIAGGNVRRTKKLKLHDKSAALEKLGRHLGMFKDNLNLNAQIGVQIVDDIGGKDG